MMRAIPTVSPVFDPARGREALAALRRRLALQTGAAAREGPRRRRAAPPRRGWLLYSAWPVGLVLTAAAAAWQPDTPEVDGPAPAASLPDVTVDYLPARFAAQEAAAPVAPTPASF